MSNPEQFSKEDRLRGQLMTLEETLRAVMAQRTAAMDAAASFEARLAIRNKAMVQLSAQVTEMQQQLSGLRDRIDQIETSPAAEAAVPATQTQQ